MVNLLELLYGVAILSALIGVVSSLRARVARSDVARHQARAKRWWSVAAISAIAAAALYWYLSPRN